MGEKGSEIDLNMMHDALYPRKGLGRGKELIAEGLKPSIHTAIPEIQIGGKSGHRRVC